LSLNGNLEDLPLLDILQIVSFSKKTGHLSIKAAAGEGAIVFQDGAVVASFTWDMPPLEARSGSPPADKQAAFLRRRIERALDQLIRLREGQFSFSLADDTPRMIGARDITAEVLPQGINAQELLLDLARGMDEDRRDSTAALEASFAAPPADLTAPSPDAGDRSGGGPVPSAATAPPSTPIPSAAAAPPAPALAPGASEPAAAGPAAAEEPTTILLVDDEDEVRRILAEGFTRGGYNVVEAEDPDSAVKKGGRLAKAAIPFLLVTDLGMPTSGGTSFHGGFEVVKRLWKMNLHPQVLLMAETLNGALQARARQMEISNFVFKPGLSKLDPEQFEADLRAFAGKIVSDVLPRLRASATAVPVPASDSAQRQGSVPGTSTPAPSRAAAVPPEAGRSPAAEGLGRSLPSADEISRDFAHLQRWLEELRRPQDATQISTLVMRVARDCFERGALFVVKGEAMRGLGGFGAAPRGEKLGLIVREVVIPLDEESLFATVAHHRRLHAGAWPDDKWARHLLGKIGRFQSAGFALLPLLTNRETVAVLFGDNPDSGRPPGRLGALETFVNQAGIALENAFLQRKVHAMSR
jgi:CheY-like chemotaxis protein